MTQTELRTFVFRLRCCSSEKASELALKLAKGNKCNTKELTILNGLISTLLPYEVDGDYNCIDTDEYESIVDHARQICKICDCE